MRDDVGCVVMARDDLDATDEVDEVRSLRDGLRQCPNYAEEPDVG